MLDPFYQFLLKLLGAAIVFAAIGMAFKSNKGKLSQSANTFGSVILAVIVASLGALLYASQTDFGQRILTEFGIA